MKMSLLAATVATAAVCGGTNAATYRVSQETAPGAGDFAANVLGTIEGYSTALTGPAFYKDNPLNGYNGDDNGGPAPVSNLTQLLLIEGSDGISVGFVHDRQNDGTVGEATTTFALTNATAAFTLGDDAGDTYTTNASQTTLTAVHAWAKCCTDGGVLGPLDGPWSLIVSLSATVNIDRWRASSSDNNHVGFAPPTSNLRVQIAPVPLPPTAALFLAALGGLASVRRSRARRSS